MKIGLFGGTFNPPHNGHIRLLRHFADTVGFDKILVVPDKRPVHKICTDLALDSERLAMCRLAFSDPRYAVSAMEIERESDSYTVYTVRDILRQNPTAELYLILGSDMFLSFHKWYKYREILDACTLCVASREDTADLQTLRAYAFEKLRIYIPDRTAPHILLSPMQPFPVSSTALRAALAAGNADTNLLPEEVLAYIKEKKLYGYRTKC